MKPSKTQVVRKISIEMTLPSEKGDFSIAYKTGDGRLTISLPPGTEFSDNQVERILEFIATITVSKIPTKENIRSTLQFTERRECFIEIAKAVGLQREQWENTEDMPLMQHIGEKVGIHWQTMHRWMKGTSIPDEKTIEKFIKSKNIDTIQRAVAVNALRRLQKT